MILSNIIKVNGLHIPVVVIVNISSIKTIIVIVDFTKKKLTGHLNAMNSKGRKHVVF